MLSILSENIACNIFVVGGSIQDWGSYPWCVFSDSFKNMKVRDGGKLVQTIPIKCMNMLIWLSLKVTMDHLIKILTRTSLRPERKQECCSLLILTGENESDGLC